MTMGVVTKIESADHTFQPWYGCHPVVDDGEVSPGCAVCFAEGWAKRSGLVKWGAQQPRRLSSEAHWRQPLAWDRLAAREGRMHVVLNTLCDIFDDRADPAWRARWWALVKVTPNLLWTPLTKRPENIPGMLPPDWGDGYPNVMLMVTCEDQKRANLRIPRLFEAPARWYGCYYEPAAGPIDFRRIKIGEADGRLDALTGAWIADDMNEERRCPRLSWIVAGGATGPRADPAHPAWFRQVCNDVCEVRGRDGPPWFHLKQWGEWKPTSGVDVYCHGPDHNAREFPNVQGIAWLGDGRVCLRDFSITEHARRIRNRQAFNTRAIDVDEQALEDFHAACADPNRIADNPLGFQWMYRVGSKVAGRLLDGRTWDEFPAAARRPTP